VDSSTIIPRRMVRRGRASPRHEKFQTSVIRSVGHWVGGSLGCRNKFIKHRTTANAQLTLGGTVPGAFVFDSLLKKAWWVRSPIDRG
jgi:hypothetical protein